MKHEVDAFYQKVRDAREQQLRKLRRTAEDIHLPELLISLMKDLGTIDTLRAVSDDLEISMELDKIVLTGAPDDIASAKLKIRETKDKIPEISIEHNWSQECVNFVKGKPDVQSSIDNLLKKDNIFAKWQVEVRQIILYAYKEDDIYTTYQGIGSLQTEISQLFKMEIKDKNINLRPEEEDLLQDDNMEWNELHNDLTETHDRFAFWDLDQRSHEYPVIHVYGLKDSVNQIEESVKNFFLENVVLEETMQDDAIKVRFIQTHMEDVIDKIKTRLTKEKVTIRPSRKFFICFNKCKLC